MASLGLGLAALGRPGYLTLGHAEDVADDRVAAMRDHAFSMLDEAVRLGLRHFDVARSYGLAEAFLAEWLARHDPSGVMVSSKWGYRYTAGWQRTADVHEVKEHSLENFKRQWTESHRLLGARLQLYQVHSLTLESPVLTDRALQGALASVRERGCALGASVSGARQAEVIDRLLSLSVDGERLFDSVQATWNLLERSAAPALARARTAGLTVIIKEALANGRLSSRGGLPVLEAKAAELHATPDALALAVALAQPFADVVLSGAATLAQLRSNAVSSTLTVPSDALSELTETPPTYWSERARLTWT